MFGSIKAKFVAAIQVAVLCCTAAVGQSVHTVKTYYDVFDVHIKAIEQITDDYKLHGQQKYYYEDGALQALYNFRFNEKDGIQKTFFENGKPQTIYSYKRGKYDGQQKEYVYQDALYYLSKEALYRNDTMISQTEYYADGKKLDQYKRNGLNATWDENGAKTEENTNVDGLMQGDEKEWRGGKLVLQGRYQDDRAEGLWQYFDTTGMLIGYEGFSQGQDTGEARIYLNDMMVPVQNKSEAKYLRAVDYRAHAPGYENVHHARDFYGSGEKYWDGYLMDNSQGNALIVRKFYLVSNSKYLYKNGKVQSEGFYKVVANEGQPIKDGKWKYYTETGDLDHEEQYSNGQLVTSISVGEADSLASHLSSADRYFQDKAYGKAITEYQKVIQTDPYNKQANEGVRLSKQLNDSISEIYNGNRQAIGQKVEQVGDLYNVRDEFGSSISGAGSVHTKKKALFNAYVILKDSLLAKMDSGDELSGQLVLSNEVIALCDKMTHWASGDTKELEKSLKNVTEAKAIEQKMGLK